MATKIKQTDNGKFIVYESNDSDDMEYEEFDTWNEAEEWRQSLDEIVEYYDVDTDKLAIADSDMDDINDAGYG